MLQSSVFLAAVALPAYQDYTARAKVAEPLALMSGAKTDLYETYVADGAFPAAGDDEATNMIAMLENSEYVAAGVTYTVTGGNRAEVVIAVENVNSDADTGEILFRLDAGANGLELECAPNDGGNAIETKFLPNQCRDSLGS